MLYAQLAVVQNHSKHVAHMEREILMVVISILLMLIVEYLTATALHRLGIHRRDKLVTINLQYSQFNKF
jgi:competence protein ComGC